MILMKKYYVLVLIIGVLSLFSSPTINTAFGGEITNDFDEISRNELDRIYQSQGYNYRIEYLYEVEHLMSEGRIWKDIFRLIIYAVDYEINEEKKELMLGKIVWIDEAHTKKYGSGVVLKYGQWEETYTIPQMGDGKSIIRTWFHYARFIPYPI